MTFQLIRFEFTLLRHDRRAWGALCFFAALLLLSLASTALDISRSNHDKLAVASAERARWLGQSAKDPHSAAHQSIFVFKPAPALALLDLGIEPFVGQAVWLEAHTQHDMLYRPQGSPSVLQRAGLFSPASLLIGFAPLVACLLTYAVLARDRERGVWRLSVGTALSPARLVWTKFLVVWGAMNGLLVAPPALLALLWSVMLQQVSADLLLRLLAWTIAFTSYFAILVAVGFALSLRASSVRLSLAVGVGLWIIFALVLPRAISTTVQQLQPLPTTQSVKQQIVEQAPVYWSAETGADQQRQILKRYGATQKRDLAIDLRGAQLDLAERHSHDVFDRVLGGFYAQVVAQDHLFAWLAALSPAAVMHSVSTALAGTDFAHHHRFIIAAETYRRALVNRMNQEVMARPANHDGPRHLSDNSLWSQIDEFRFAAPPMQIALAVIAPSMAALAAWLLAALAIMSRVARKVRP